jgi:hypothetical protein
MMPVPGMSPRVIFWIAEAASHGIANGDWLSLATGVLVGMCAMALAILIAWRQRVIQVRDRSADQAARQAEQEQLEGAERDRQARLSRRDVWRAEYEEDRELLRLGEDIAYQVCNRGPFTAVGLRSLRLDEFIMEAEQLADRGVESLRGPLLKLAGLGQHLSQVAVPPDEEAVTRYAGSGEHDGVSAQLPPHALQRLAVSQDRIARELAEEITAAWPILRAEWEG